jgi:hypothetical protein
LRPVHCRRLPYQLPVALQLSNSAGQNAKHLLVISAFVVQNRMHEAYTWLQLVGALIAESTKPIVIAIKKATRNNLCISSASCGLCQGQTS